MEIIRIPMIMLDVSMAERMRGKTIGFIPTMGALHEGHLNLVRMAKGESNISVVSIYVNPKQFGPAEDFLRYPRDTEGDIEKLAREGVDILFLPDDSHMYPEGFTTQVRVEVLSERLCGFFRPGHFTGVATVVTKLFNIVLPHKAYFGQKDYQQTVIIERLVKDLSMGVEIVMCPTTREKDGLAMSSRNAYLLKEERQAATVIHSCLREASEAVRSGTTDVKELKRLMENILRSVPLVSDVQYASAYNPETLEELEKIEEKALLAVAVKIGGTRLIDNLTVAPARNTIG
jgi:pantoate--beta-alanine ligase